MDVEKDKKYFFIAREGLKAPLPEQWHVYQNKYDEQRFYLNSITGEKQQEHPCDEFYKKKFQETKMKDQAKNGIRNNQDSQDINEGFVGDSRVLDSSMNQSFNQNFLLNQENYQEIDETAQQKLGIEREILEEYQNYEGQLLQQYKTKNVEYENIRKKEQKELDKLIDKELKELKKELKLAEDDQLKRLNNDKKQIKKNVESNNQEELKMQLKDQDSIHEKNKKKSEEEEEQWVEKQAKKYQQELHQKYEVQNRGLDKKRDERSDAQKKLDEKFKDAKQRVARYVAEYKQAISSNFKEQIDEIESEQFDYKRDQQERLQEQLDEEYALKKQQNEETISKIRIDLKNKRSAVNKEYEEKTTQKKNELISQGEMKMKMLKTDTETNKIDSTLANQNELERQKRMAQLQAYILSEKNELELKQQKQDFQLNRDVKTKYDNLIENLKQEGAQKLKKIKEQLKLNTDLDEHDFDLICQKQETQTKIEQLKQELELLRSERDKYKKQLDKVNQENHILMTEYSQTFQKNKILLLSNDLRDIEKKIEKNSNTLYEKETLAKRLEDLALQKKQDIHIRKKENIQFQKNLILLKEQQKLQKQENIISQVKYDELLQQIGNLKQTLHDKFEQQSFQYANNHEDSKINEKDQEEVLKNNKSNPTIHQNLSRQNQKKAQSKPNKRKPSYSQKHSDVNTKRRNWLNKLITERNILIEMKSKMKNKKEFIQQLQKLLGEEQMKITEELGKEENIINQSQLNDYFQQFNNQQIGRSNVFSHNDKLNKEINQFRQMEILYSMKDKSLSQMEKLYDEITSENSQKQFNEDTFIQLYKVYQNLEVNEIDQKLGNSEFNRDRFDQLQENQSYHFNGQIQNNTSDNWKLLINYPNSTVINKNNQNQISEQDELVMDKTTLSINHNNNNTLVTNPNIQNFSSTYPSSSRYDIKSALVTIKQKYTIPPSFSNSLTDFQSKSFSSYEDPLVTQIKKKNQQKYNDDMLQYSNWVQKFKQELNSQILDGPFASHKLKTII